MKSPLLQLFFLLLFCSDAFAQAGMWTWVNGDSVPNSPGVFGVQGVPSTNNHPPGLYEPCQWHDKQGNIWVYGGNYQTYSDMWKFNPSTLEWTWIKGNGLTNQLAYYGIKGIPNLLNTPGIRPWAPATWIDTSGIFWLFGGSEDHNDLWKYDITTNQWTWVSGNTIPNAYPQYGTKGIPSILNIPGGRTEVVTTWTDPNNNLWLFGGLGNDAYMNNDDLNDLWRYNISTNEWTWMNGSDSVDAIPIYGVKGVSNSTNNPGARNCHSAWTNGQNDLYFFGGKSFNTWACFNDVWKYQLMNNEWTWIAGNSNNIDSGNYQFNCVFDSTSLPHARFENKSTVPDNCGNLWTFGGYYDLTNVLCFSDLWIFNMQNKEWNLVNGSNVPNLIGNYGIKGLSAISNIPPSRGGAVAWWSTDKKFYMFGGMRMDNQSNSFSYNDVWIFNPDTICTPCLSTAPIINLQSSDTTFCEKNCINFFDLSTNNPTSWQWYFPGASPDTSTLQNPTGICYNTYGNYDVTLIACNGNGCDSLLLTNFITCFQNPVDSIYQSNDTLYSLPAFSYQWYETSSGIIAGATNQFYVLSQPGSYFCVVSDSVGCVASSNTLTITGTAGPLTPEGGITIVPNPNSGKFEIVFSNDFFQSVSFPVKINVMDLTGRIVFESEIISPSAKTEIDLSELNDAVYFLCVIDNQKQWSLKVAVKKE